MPSSSSTSERIRTLRACTACSARKVKCDGMDQCAACKKHGVQCIYVNSGKKRGPPKGAPARGGPKRRVVDPSETSPSTSATSTSKSPIHAAGRDLKPTLGDMRSPSHLRPHSSAHLASTSASGLGSGERRIAPMVRIVTPPTLEAASTSASSVETFESMLGLDHLGRNGPDDMMELNPNHGLLSPATGRTATVPLPSQIPIHPMPTPISVPGPPSSSPSLGAHAGLSDKAIDELLLLYETFIHQHWPIIYLPALRSLRALETRSPLVFDAILALSATNQDLGHNVGFGHSMDPSFDPRSARPYAAISETLVESVRQRVLTNLGSCDLPTIQATILITLVDIGYGRTQYAYHMGGIACRMAIDLGLHTRRMPGVTSSLSGRQEHEQYRTLWACFILDKVLAALLQRPPMMRSVVIDTPRPSTMERDELDLWLAGRASQYLQPTSVSEMECSKSHALSTFNAWIDVMIILEDILEHVYRPSECRARIESPETAGRHYDELVVGIDGALRAWRRNLPSHLQWDDADDRAHLNVGPHILTVRGWYYTCMVLVHRPRVPFLDAAASPHSDAAEALSRMSHSSTNPNTPAHKRLPRGIDASRDAASNICQLLEGYRHSFRVRKFPSAWVYMIFQAGTVHGGLAARPSPSPFIDSDTSLGLSPQRGESFQRLEQCIRWLDQIGITWDSASHHSEILRRISAVGARTRPPSPRFDEIVASVTLHQDHGQGQNVFDLIDTGTAGTASTSAQQLGGHVVDPNAQQNEELLNAWILFWAGMPTASDDLSLWQGFESMFTDNPQIVTNQSPLQ